MMYRTSQLEMLFGIYAFTYHVLFFVSVSASIIDIQTHPSTITPLLTPSLTVSCFLNDTSGGGTGSGSGLVGRRNAGHVGERDLSEITSTPYNVSFIISMILQRGSGQQLARVTEHTAARLLTSEKDAVVDGSLVDTGGARGHLSITWTNPEESTSGAFVCEVNALTEDGHSVVFAKSATVSVNEPSIADVVQMMHTRTLEIKNLTEENQRLRNDMIQLNQETSSLKVGHALAIQNLTNEIQQLRLNVTTRVAFSAVRETSSSSTQYETVSSDQTVMFNKVLTNIGGGFDTNTATFVCPVAGPYYITHDMGVFGGNYGSTRLSVNGEDITYSVTGDSNYNGNEGLGVVVELSKGDKVKVVAVGGSTFYWWATRSGSKHLYMSVFSGFLLK